MAHLRPPRRAAFCLLLGTVFTVPLPGLANAQTAPPWPGTASYSVPLWKLDEALSCHGGKWSLTGSGRAQPVLLVHGTGVTREQNWGWNYWRQLPLQGFEVCWVQLPNSALGDIQIASEYVARAVSWMHWRTCEKVDILGHSQGGLENRWAIKWFPSGRFVDDYIALATPNHGTITAGEATPCFRACWQMRLGSKFLRALNYGDETPGPISHTSIYTAFDEVVQPQAPESTSAIAGARNILLQDICPGRPVGHVSIAADYVTWRLVTLALVYWGPAPATLPVSECAGVTMPAATSAPPDLLTRMNDYSQGEPVSEEPPLRPYAARYGS